MLGRLLRRFSSEPGFMYAWGDAYNLRLGQDHHIDPLFTPTRIQLRTRLFLGVNDMAIPLHQDSLILYEDLPNRFVKAATGPFHCALLSEKGELYTFGENDFKKLGHNRHNAWLPTKLPFGFSRVVDAACGYDFSLALTQEGAVFSWGYGGEAISFWKAVFYTERPGALGQGDYGNYSTPTLVEALKSVKVAEVHAGYEHALVRSDEGQVFVWGNNEFGGLGLPGVANLTLPREVRLPCAVKQVSAARNYCAALGVTGEVFVWGENSHGQLGVPEKMVEQPRKVAEGVDWLEAGECCLALVSDRRLRVSGLEQLQMQEFELPARPVSVSCGDEFFAAVLSSGLVYHYGGLFKNRRSCFFLRRPTQLEVVERSFFPTKVLRLFGKYSYHLALLEASALQPVED